MLGDVTVKREEVEPLASSLKKVLGGLDAFSKLTKMSGIEGMIRKDRAVVEKFIKRLEGGQ